MNTELYKTIKIKLLESGESKRGFAEKHKLPRAWFIEFMNPKKPFRVLRVQTMSMLHSVLDIPYEVIEDYNTWAEENQSKGDE